MAHPGWISNIIYARHTCVCAEDPKPALLAVHLPQHLPQQMVSSSQGDNHKLNSHTSEDNHKETRQFWRGTVAADPVWAQEGPNTAMSCLGPSLSMANVGAARASLLCFTEFHLEKSFKKSFWFWFFFFKPK